MLRKIQLSYFFRFLGDALFYPFMSLYLISRSIEGDKLGLILGALPLITIVANLVFSFMKINHKYDKPLLIVMLLFEGLMIFIYGFNFTFLIYFILTLFVGFTNNPYYSLLDSYTTRNYVDSKEYPRVRIMGSIAYIFGGAFGGILIEKLGYFYVFLIASISYFISFIFLQLLKKNENMNYIEERNETNYKETLNRYFILYVLFYVLILGSNNVFDSYYNVYLQQLGFDLKAIGIINSLIIISETIVMFIMIKVMQHKINYQKFLFFCGLTLVIKDIIFYFDLPNWLLICASLLRGVGWGGILAVNVNVIVKLVKQKNLTFALLFLVIIFSLFRSIANYIVGDIYLSVGFNVIFLVVGIIQIFGLLLLLCSRRFGEILKDEKK